MTGRSGARPVLAGCRIIISAQARAAGASAAGNRSAGADELDRALGAAGADVMRVVTSRPVTTPTGVLHRAVHRAGSGGADAVLFTASSASWIDAATRSGALEAHRRRAEAGRLLLVSDDEREARRLQDAGLNARYVERERPTGLVGCVVAHYGSGAGSVRTDAGSLEVRSGGVVLDGRFLPLSRGAADLIEALFLARGRVLSRRELGRELPGGERSGRAVEVAVARLRESLGGVDLVQTVVKRGYRLAVSEP